MIEEKGVQEYHATQNSVLIKQNHSPSTAISRVAQYTANPSLRTVIAISVRKIRAIIL